MDDPTEVELSFQADGDLEDYLHPYLGKRLGLSLTEAKRELAQNLTGTLLSASVAIWQMLGSLSPRHARTFTEENFVSLARRAFQNQSKVKATRRS